MFAFWKGRRPHRKPRSLIPRHQPSPQRECRIQSFPRGLRLSKNRQISSSKSDTLGSMKLKVAAAVTLICLFGVSAAGARSHKKKETGSRGSTFDYYLLTLSYAPD